MPTVDYMGKVIEFPEGTTKEVMGAALRKKFSAPSVEQLASVNIPPDPGGPLPDALPVRALDRIDANVRVAQDPPVQPLPDVQPSQARKAVQTAGVLGVTPEFALQNLKEFEPKVDDLRSLNGLPALTRYASKGPIHAGSVLDDVQNLGVLDWVFGPKSTLRPEALDQPTDPGLGGKYGRFASMSGLQDIGYN